MHPYPREEVFPACRPRCCHCSRLAHCIALPLCQCTTKSWCYTGKPVQCAFGCTAICCTPGLVPPSAVHQLRGARCTQSSVMSLAVHFSHSAWGGQAGVLEGSTRVGVTPPCHTHHHLRSTNLQAGRSSLRSSEGSRRSTLYECGAVVVEKLGGEIKLNPLRVRCTDAELKLLPALLLLVITTALA